MNSRSDAASLISELISSFDPDMPNFRPTEIYNEGWLLRAVLQQASLLERDDFPLAFLPGATWFSEALLPTAFKSRSGKDDLAESRTSADGVIGHVVVGRESKAGLELKPDGAQLTVIEAKIGSPLSEGTTNAPYFDQAARTVACMAEVLRIAERNASQMKRLDFIVLSPESSIDEGLFAEEMRKESIRNKVEQRVAAYKGDLNAWRDDCFGPTVECVKLHVVRWEKAIDWIAGYDTRAGNALQRFYSQCLEFA